MPFLPPNQQRQSTEGKKTIHKKYSKIVSDLFLVRLEHPDARELLGALGARASLQLGQIAAASLARLLVTTTFLHRLHTRTSIFPAHVRLLVQKLTKRNFTTVEKVKVAHTHTQWV